MTSPGVAGASASAVVPATPDAVFRVVIDLARLSEWNQTVATVLELPPELEPGAEWVVEMHALGQSWPSRSRLEVLDHAERRFAYRA